jgi:hypothetical protein
LPSTRSGRRRANWECRTRHERSAAAPIREGSLPEGLHARPQHDRSRPPVHARCARRLPLLLARHRLRRAPQAAVVQARGARGAAALPRVHAPPHARPPPDLRRVAPRHAHRAARALSRDALLVRAAPGLRARDDVAAHRLPAAQPPRAARSGRPPVAQERPGDCPADSAGDAAARCVPRRRARSLRHDATGQHRGRRLLRHPAAARRARAAGARRRRRTKGSRVPAWRRGSTRRS